MGPVYEGDDAVNPKPWGGLQLKGGIGQERGLGGAAQQGGLDIGAAAPQGAGTMLCVVAGRYYKAQGGPARRQEGETRGTRAVMEEGKERSRTKGSKHTAERRERTQGHGGSGVGG